jgi:peroxidase
MIVTWPKETDVLLGESVLLNCSARGVPEPLITWTKNDEPLDFDNARFQLLENGSLLLQDVMMNDSGDYQCNANNELGFDQSDDAPLMINSE